jgi:phenylalanyl-tRNA synthetase beta chain
MNILIPDEWLREFVETNASPRKIQQSLSLCGPSVERLRKTGKEYVYDIEITTNRVDLMSVIGIAQEATAILPQFKEKATLIHNPLRTALQIPSGETVSYLTVTVDPRLCFRFSAILISGVKVAPSPDWVLKRLELAGMRGLNNVIDTSNYLMLELGQPVHTFDYDKIVNHQMILRESQKGEKLTTLDEKVHHLPGGDIVIEDGSGKLIDLCGIMGGLNSAVDGNTSNVLLFVQTYDPGHIRRTSMSLAQRTQAATIFEKGLPVEKVIPTIQKGIELLVKLTGGTPAGKVIDILNIKPLTGIVSFQMPIAEFISQRMGIAITLEEIDRILQRLDFIIKSDTQVIVPPARRLDVTIPEDIVEEVARIHGYFNIPGRLMNGELPTKRDDRGFYWEQRIKSALSHWGYTEVYTSSLVPKTDSIGQPALRLKNPLSEEWTYLRTSLVPSHQQVIDDNISREQVIRLFEIADVYLPKPGGLPNEEQHLIISSTDNDFFLIKGVAEALFRELGLTFIAEKDMSVMIGKNKVGQITHSVNPNAWFIEIRLQLMVEMATSARTYSPISKFPPIEEDVNLTLKPDQSYADVVAKLQNLSPLIEKVAYLGRYENKLTLRITYHASDRQLSTSDIEPIRQKVINF